MAREPVAGAHKRPVYSQSTKKTYYEEQNREADKKMRDNDIKGFAD